MSEKRPAETSEQPPRPKRSRFGPINDKASTPATPAGTTTLPANGVNGTKAPSSLPNAKALELLAKKDALKAQIQALKVDKPATEKETIFWKAHRDISNEAPWKTSQVQCCMSSHVAVVNLNNST